MTDKSLEEIKAKLKAAKQAKVAKEAEENQARARTAEKKKEVAKLFNTKIGIFPHVIENLNREFEDTGFRIFHKFEEGSEWGTELQRRIIALRPLSVADVGMDRLIIEFTETGSVEMSYGTKVLKPAGSSHCSLEEFDADRLRRWILDFIDKNVPDV